MPVQKWRWVLGITVGAAYALISHWLMTQDEGSALALLIVLGPVAGLGLAGLWSSGKRLLAVAGLVLGSLLGGLALRGESLSSQWLYLTQHAGIHLALALWFGSTLRRGRQPLISALALRLHGHLAPGMAAYTRQLTQAWVLYFLGMTTVSIGLFALGDFRHWSLLANVVTPVSAAVMFVGEYLLRYRLHPEFERVSFSEMMQAYRAHQQDRDGQACKDRQS